MAKYVPDVSSSRWVIIADGRENRPDELREDAQVSDQTLCPFCEGNERLTLTETYRVGEGKPGEPGWEVRVIPNKYPITDTHEVIIHSPSEKDLHHLPKEHINLVFQTFRHRYQEYRKEGQVIIFCNRGEHAGASIEHPHSQLVVLPNQINISALEREPLDNIVEENTFFNIYCPDFSQWPYEVWIAPKVEGTMFGDITDEEIEDLIPIYTNVLKRLEKIHETKSTTGKGFSYNFYIYPKESWYIRIIPRFVYRAGFELGTGLSVNVHDPKDAAEHLRTGIDPHSFDSIEGMEDEIDRLKGKLKAMGIES
jgi:UDPglucose--hexose-1-phosphate uridylyltransferase